MATFLYSNFVSTLGRGASLTITPVSNTAVKESSISKGVQVIARPGGRWRLDITWRNLDDAKRRVLQGLLAALDGAANILSVSPRYITGEDESGAWSGTPLVKGGSQTGNTLEIDGATASITGWAKAGDYFRIGTQLMMVTADADSDASGNVTLSHWPELRGSPADNAVVGRDSGILCDFRMISEPALTTSVEQSIVSGSVVTGYHSGTVTATFLDVGAAG